MRIDDQEGFVVFDNLFSVTRDLGSDETITMQKPAKTPEQKNAKGVFADRTLLEINESAKTAAGRIVNALLT